MPSVLNHYNTSYNYDILLKNILNVEYCQDSECERMEVGFTTAEDKSCSMPRSHRSNDNLSSDEEDRLSAASGYSATHLGVSVFDYIDRLMTKSSVMFNTMYCVELQQKVLRPFSHQSDLVIWDYYIKEELRHGPFYDPEYAEMDLAQEDEGNLCEARAQTSTITQGNKGKLAKS